MFCSLIYGLSASGRTMVGGSKDVLPAWGLVLACFSLHFSILISKYCRKMVAASKLVDMRIRLGVYLTESLQCPQATHLLGPARFLSFELASQSFNPYFLD